jgi:hypothetical protein
MMVAGDQFCRNDELIVSDQIIASIVLMQPDSGVRL